MKAEHRKELQTNALADRMGRVLRGMKQKPGRGSFLTVVLVGLVILAGLFFWWRRTSANQREARRWVDFEKGQDRIVAELSLRQPSRGDPQLQYLFDLANRSGNEGTPQSRAANMEIAWALLYDGGIKSLGDPGATKNIQQAKKYYTTLLDLSEVKDDPILGPEARYAIAVADEALAIDSIDLDEHLKKTAKLYQAVVDDYPRSAHAERAEKRAKQLKNPEQRRPIAGFYTSMRMARELWRQGIDTPQHFKALIRDEDLK
jgi:hypothetical protein